MWNYVPILIGVCGASVVVGIYWKLKKSSVSRLKLLRIALCAAFVLSLVSSSYVPLKSGAALIWFWMAEAIVYLVLVRLGSRLKNAYQEFRLDPQQYRRSRLLCVNETVKPIIEALVPKGSWKDVRIGEPVSPGPLQIGLAIVASIVALIFFAITRVFFFSEEEYLRLPVWTFRYSLLFSAAIITFSYLMVLVLLAALRWLRILLSPIRFGKSLQCVVDWSGYGAALASCLVLVLPALFLIVDKVLNSSNHATFSLSLLFDAASVGALGGLVIGCFLGLFSLIDSRNVLYNSISPAAFFVILDLGLFYRVCKLRPSILLYRYLESHSIEGVDSCDDVETAKLLYNECLSWECERYFAVVKKCDPSVGALLTNVDAVYFWTVVIVLLLFVVWRVVLTFKHAWGGDVERDISIT
ncbi:hypothetical protein HMPREF0970_00047 [Schaalia odontolytica F0309]|uniref:Uncharacterized protein n=1 Tax=Schaalia odontolytica F0309 TaxID=649742 RepID=D4TVV5_9ACTO|nr:hypothetical protein [Schaalia odontolytica]EFF80969.1 hypothetical protein HMPREF0970_00047 [Schaalia odontolytica F0309]